MHSRPCISAQRYALSVEFLTNGCHFRVPDGGWRCISDERSPLSRSRWWLAMHFRRTVATFAFQGMDFCRTVRIIGVISDERLPLCVIGWISGERSAFSCGGAWRQLGPEVRSYGAGITTSRPLSINIMIRHYRQPSSLSSIISAITIIITQTNHHHYLTQET